MSDPWQSLTLFIRYGLCHPRSNGEDMRVDVSPSYDQLFVSTLSLKSKAKSQVSIGREKCYRSE